MIRRLPRSTVLALALAGALAVPTAVAAQMTAKDAAKELKSATKTALASLKTALKDQAATLQFQLGELIGDIEEAEVDLGLESIDAAEQLIGAALATVLDEADTAQRSVESTASGLLAQLADPAAADFVLGDGGTLDKFVAGVEKEFLKTRASAVKIIAKFAKSLLKVTNKRVKLAVALPLHSTSAPPRPSPVASPITPAKQLRIDVQLGSSDIEVDGDGVLCIGGTSQPGAGNVTIVITDPAGDTEQQIVTVNPTTCRWRACFDELDEGNYTISVTQTNGASGQAVSGGVGVP